MTDIIYGLVLSIAGFVVIMAVVITIGRSVDRWLGPKDQ
jgi:hypothetical protein